MVGNLVVFIFLGMVTVSFTVEHGKLILQRNFLPTSLYCEQLCNYIAENWNMYEYFANSHSLVNCTLSNYRKHMLQQKCWATADMWVTCI